MEEKKGKIWFPLKLPALVKLRRKGRRADSIEILGSTQEWCSRSLLFRSDSRFPPEVWDGCNVDVKVEWPLQLNESAGLSFQTKAQVWVVAENVIGLKFFGPYEFTTRAIKTQA